MSENQQSRFEKSLGLLTTRFVSLLQKAKDGVLDLKVVIANKLFPCCVIVQTNFNF